MRSLMRSHRRSSSLDSSPGKSPNKNKDLQRSSNEYGASFQSAPPVPPPLNSPRHSPSFDSLQKFAKQNKIFSSKLFKKNSNSSVSTRTGTTPVTPSQPEFQTVSSPEHNSNGPEKLAYRQAPVSSLEEFPAIKGTRTHEWGDNSEVSNSVIILNNPSPESSDFSSDIGEPSFSSNIQRLQRNSIVSSTATLSSVDEAESSAVHRCFHLSQNSPLLKEETEGEEEDREDASQETKQIHPFMSLTTVKSKNRQARIHSHDDIISLGKNSALSFNLLSSTFSPLQEIEDNPEVCDSSSRNEAKNSPKMKCLGLNIQGLESNSSVPSSIQSSHMCDSTFRADTFVGSSDETDGYINESEEESGECSSDDSSKFSFEVGGGLNGRTSSIKYYSKPDPMNTVYIDDVYEDENFDEDMNCYDEDVDSNDENDEIIQDRNEYLFSDKYTNKFNGASSQENLNGFHELHQQSNEDTGFTFNSSKNVKGFKDIYKLTDSESEERYDDNSFDAYDDDEGFTGEIEEEDDVFAAGGSKIKGYGDIYNLSDEEPFNKPTSIQSHKAMENEAGNNEDTDPLNCEEQPKDNRKSREYESKSNDTDEAPQKNSKDHTNLMAHLSTPRGNGHASRRSSMERPITPISYSITTPEGNTLRSPFSSNRSPTNNLSSQLLSPLPPPARSQSLKYHDLNSSLDSDIPGAMSNLYFINEVEEDQYNQKNRLDDDYLDEINGVPEDFNFSDNDSDVTISKSPEPRINGYSFRRTHSYSEKPLPAVKEKSPNRYKLEIKNKTVTFFHGGIGRSLSDAGTYNLSPVRSPCPSGRSPNKIDDYILSPDYDKNLAISPNFFRMPSPSFSQSNSLSPIQENASSVDNSPVLQ